MPTSAQDSQVHIQSQAQAGPSTVPATMSVAAAASSSAGAAGAAADSCPPSAPKGPHLMRIATQGKIKIYRQFALKFLQENPSRPLVLHTLPPIPSTSNQPQPGGPSKVKSAKPKAPATATIPMLVSTVENVKRTYLELYTAALDKGKGREDGPTPMLGLWQYNETGCLEDLEEYRAVADEAERDELLEAERALNRLKDVLEGKTGPKMRHTPYMKVTLSTRPLPDLAAQKRVTYQHIPLPPPPKRTKAKARARRRALQAKGREQPTASEADNGEVTAGQPASVEARGGPLTALAQKITEAAGGAAAGAAGKGKRRPEEALERSGPSKKKKVAP